MKSISNMTKKQIKILNYLGGLIFISIFIYSGFNVKIKTVSGCTSHAEAFMQANFSEVTIEINYEGYPEASTDYWDERVSDIRHVRMNEYEIVSTNSSYNTVNGISTPKTDFDYDKSASRKSNFDDFSLNYSHDLSQHFKDGDKISISSSEYEKCNNNLNKQIFVKHWYFFSYGV